MQLMTRDEFIDTVPYGSLYFVVQRDSQYLKLRLQSGRVGKPECRRRSVRSALVAVQPVPGANARSSQHLASARFVVLSPEEQRFINWLLKVDLQLVIRIHWNRLNNSYLFEFEGEFNDPDVISMINRYKYTFGYS